MLWPDFGADDFEEVRFGQKRANKRARCFAHTMAVPSEPRQMRSLTVLALGAGVCLSFPRSGAERVFEAATPFRAPLMPRF